MTQGPQAEDPVLLDLVGDVVGLLELAELRTGLLSALLRAVPSRWASLNEVGPGGVFALAEPPIDQKWHDKFAEFAHENPLYVRFSETMDGRAYRFSDVTTRAGLEATRLYREVYVPLRVNHQIAFTLPADADNVLAIALSREHPDYSDAERDLLNRARPYLIQAYRNAIAYSQARGAPAEGMTEALVAQGLTTRQAEVVRLVALGSSNRDIGAELGLSDRTVQKHLEHAFPVLRVTTRSEAANRAWAMAADGRPASAPSLRPVRDDHPHP